MNQPLFITHDIYKSTVSLYKSEAFGNVWQSGLVCKLKWNKWYFIEINNYFPGQWKTKSCPKWSIFIIGKC